VKSQFATSSWGGKRKLPYAFTEQGIYMLATVLKGELAEQQSIFIMRAFKEMRHFIANNALMREKIDMEVDTSVLDQEIANYEKILRQCYANKEVILSDLDNMDYDDKHFQKRKTDLENRLDKVYDKIEVTETALVEAKAKKRSVLAQKVCGDNIYKSLIFFDKMNDIMNEAERREFICQLIDKVEIFEEEQANGQWLKSITFKLPIIPHDMEISLDNGMQIETV